MFGAPIRTQHGAKLSQHTEAVTRESPAASHVATGPLAAAYAAEEISGLRLAFWLRLTALVLVALFLPVITDWPQVLYYHGLMLGFVVIGGLGLIPGPGGAGSREAAWTRWLLPLADVALVTFAVIHPNPFGGDAWVTLPMRLRLDNILFFLPFVAVATLTYSPRQVLWTGAAAAICWSIAALWVTTQPGVHLAVGNGARWLAMSTAERTAILNNGDWVNALLVLKQVILLLIVTVVLAGAVGRSRALMLRQVRAASERAQLARYFSANLVEELADAERPLGDIRNQTVAVLFVDIVGFTGLSEAAPPAAVIGLLRDFHQRMQTAVFAHQGTLDKYLGDGLMTTFGTPRAGPRDAANALACARAMAAALVEWNRTRQGRGEPVIRIGIGLHWGPVVLGDIGGDNRLEFATIGDTVNVASRLEHLTRGLGAEIAVSADLVEAVRATLPGAEAEALLEGFVPASPQALRGRTTPLAIFMRIREAA
jgi:adenylate cyclase